MNIISFLYDFYMGLETVDLWISYNNYHQEEDQVLYWLEFLNNSLHIKFTEVQKKMVSEIWIHLNVETIKHCFCCVLFGDILMKEFNDRKFKSLTGYSKQEFLFGLAIHDAGKTLVPKILLETDRMLIESERKLITNMHTKFAKQVIKKFTPNMPNKIIEIATKHHKQKPMNECIKFVKVIDVAEALMSDRCYKVAFDKKMVLYILEKNFGKDRYVEMISKSYKILNDLELLSTRLFDANIIVDYYNNYRNSVLMKSHSYTVYFWRIANYTNDVNVIVKLLKEEGLL